MFHSIFVDALFRGQLTFGYPVLDDIRSYLRLGYASTFLLPFDGWRGVCFFSSKQWSWGIYSGDLSPYHLAIISMDYKLSASIQKSSNLVSLFTFKLQYVFRYPFLPSLSGCKPAPHPNISTRRLRDLIGSALDHKSLPPELESRRGLI